MRGMPPIACTCTAKATVKMYPDSQIDIDTKEPLGPGGEQQKLTLALALGYITWRRAPWFYVSGLKAT